MKNTKKLMVLLFGVLVLGCGSIDDITKEELGAELPKTDRPQSSDATPPVMEEVDTQDKVEKKEAEVSKSIKDEDDGLPMLDEKGVPIED